MAFVSCTAVTSHAASIQITFLLGRNWKTSRTELGKVEEGRLVYAGEAHPLAIMTAEDVKTIRASQEQQDVLAGRYGVSQAHISNIVRRKKWKHVP
jgi:hypothetical protein